MVDYFVVAFQTGHDSATFWDRGTEAPSLSRDKETTGQAQNLATGQDWPGQPVKIWDGTRAGHIFSDLERPFSIFCDLLGK